MICINTANIHFKLDPKSLESHTMEVERLLEPLVTVATTLVYSSNEGPSNTIKEAHLLADLVAATQKFLEEGEKIAKDSQFLKDELTAAVEDVRKQGESMKLSSGEFAEDPTSSVKRDNMISAARPLLSAVAHLLVLADMLDIYTVLLQLKLVEERLAKVHNARTKQDLGVQYKALKQEGIQFSAMAAKRQQDLKDVHHKNQMAAARGDLQRNIPMLYMASCACLQHPDIEHYKANRDLIYEQLQYTISGISNATQATPTKNPTQPAGGGELAYALNHFDKQLIVDPLVFSEECLGSSLQERLESIISSAALMADPSSTDDHKESILAECNQALQDLLSVYTANAGRKDRSDTLNTAISRMTKKTRELRQQLRKVVTNHVSVSFLETNAPCLVLIEVAKNGKEMEINKNAQVFSEHANKLIEVANMACSISDNEEGVNLVRMAVSQLESLCPLVINAALALASKPNSRISQDNIKLFQEQWEKKVCVLTDAIDNIISIEDFLCVTENHILENVNKCVIALQENDVDGLDRSAGAIRGHAARVVHVANSEMDNYETGIYTEKVLEAAKLLTDTVLPSFKERVEAAVEALNVKPTLPVDEKELIGTSRLVYDSVHNIRNAVLMSRTQEEELHRTKDPDNSNFETKDFDVGCRTSVHTKEDQTIAGQSVVYDGVQNIRKDGSDALNTSRVTEKTRELRQQLRKAVTDYVSVSFLETNVPCLALIEAAKNGKEKEILKYVQVFSEHANKLIEVANMACSVSNNEEGVSLVCMAVSQLESLCPLVINAALALASKPSSRISQDNMNLFQEQWEKKVCILKEVIDNIKSIDDFLFVTENHILEDVNKCVIALQENDVDGLDRSAGAIRGYAARVVRVATSEMDNYETGVYTEKVLEATKLLTDTVMPPFIEQVEAAVEALNANPTLPVNKNELIDVSRLVYDSVHNIRNAVLLTRTQEEELDRSDGLNTSISRMTTKTRELRQQLRKAVTNHVSVSFLETNVPCLALIEAAKNGKEEEIQKYTQVFSEHANKLIEVANMACSVSNNEEGVNLVRMAVSQLETICPLVINAALALASKPSNRISLDNMNLIREKWEKKVCILSDAIDNITSIDDFLYLTENHILEDVNKCVIALQENDVDGLNRTAGAIRGHAARVVRVATSEMENYDTGIYTKKVLEATKLLTDTVIPPFIEQVEAAVEALNAKPILPVDENKFIGTSRLVYDSVHNIRKAVLMITTQEEELDRTKDPDNSDFETKDLDAGCRTSVHTEDDQAIAGQSTRAIMAQLPQEQKEKIAEEVASFVEEKNKLDAEVSKWEDSGDDNENDIVMLAKQMCMIMMEMTDFTRGQGPLKNTSDVISAAKKIAKAGSRMEKLGHTVIDNCLDSTCKKDLLAYLQRIPLYCHQLNICSKVKAEIQNMGGELVISGIDSAMSLIQAAKNLMNAVVSTVKTCYAASKYRKSQGTQSLNMPTNSWRMKVPEKKPLVKQDDKVGQKNKDKHVNPMQALSEFKALDSI